MGLALAVFCALLDLAASASDGGCQAAEDKAEVASALKYLIASMSKTTALHDIESQHAVLVAPSDPINGGGGVAIDLYSSMPKKSVGGNTTTAFTKFVVVSSSGMAQYTAQKAIALGDDVCGASGYVDEAAVSTLQGRVVALGHFGPTVTNCTKAGACLERLGLGLQSQLPFLGAMLGPERSLKGNLLPIMLHGQGIRIASRLGDVLSQLVLPGGIWSAERVLFTFVGDLSFGLSAAQAEMCDAKAVEMLTQGGVPRVAEYFDALLSGGTREGCAGPRAVPTGYPSLLAAARVASKLRLTKRRSLVSHRTKYTPDKTFFEKDVRGFAGIVFWDDVRAPGEVLGAGQSASLLAAAPKGRRLRHTPVLPHSGTAGG